MNTQGWIRGLIAHNSDLDKFVQFISNTISLEFGFNKNILIGEESYKFYFDSYQIEVPVYELVALQKKGPYALDKYLLESLKMQGFEFDIFKSQYIQTVWK